MLYNNFLENLQRFIRDDVRNSLNKQDAMVSADEIEKLVESKEREVAEFLYQMFKEKE